jgi:hypothetical protein
MFFSKKDPSIITSGTTTQCQILANMIERGRIIATQYEALFHENSEHPDYTGPMRNCSYHSFINAKCYFMNAVGYAILGLDGDLKTIMKGYKEQVARAKLGGNLGVMHLYTAASDMLGLPTQLLWDTDFQSHMGMLVDGVVTELRKPQRGYC